MRSTPAGRGGVWLLRDNLGAERVRITPAQVGRSGRRVDFHIRKVTVRRGIWVRVIVVRIILIVPRGLLIKIQIMGEDVADLIH